MLVREARPEDAAAIAGVNVRSWGAAYRGIMPDSFLDAMSVDEECTRWERAIAHVGPRARPVLVVEDDAGIVKGFAVVGADPESPADGLVFLVYVAPEAWGAGAGYALMRESVARLERAGFARGVLWVLEANSRAREFYERQGWEADGATTTSTYGDVSLVALRYCRAL